MKLLVLAMMFLTSLNSAIPFSFDRVAKSNQDVIINETGNKVHLRQKAVKKVNNADEANIETTNVDYDLRYLYGGEKGYLNYNIWDLLPTENDSKDISYKFLCAKPVGKNLYLYVYDNDNRNGDILNATFKISKSKTQNKDTGLFEEQFAMYNARFVNSYGYKQRFMKFAIDNIVNLESDVRMFVDSGSINYLDPSSGQKYIKVFDTINHEFAFNVGGEKDFMGDYFSDDYVRITEKDVGILLTNKDLVEKNIYTSAYEDTYCFFNTDRKIDELKEVSCEYIKISYKVNYKGINIIGHGFPNINKCDIYGGLYNNSADDLSRYGGFTRETYGFDIFVEKPYQKIIKSDIESYTVEEPYFLWWNQNVKYSLPTIQDCLNTSNLDNEKFKGVKVFIDDFQKQRVSNNQSKYQWCFKLDNSLRKVVDFYDTGNIFNHDFHAIAECHEIKQVLILQLKFRTNNQDFTFNAFDIPTDTSFISVQNVPYKTLGDIVLDKVINTWDWFKSIFSGVVKNIVPLLISVAVIMVVVLCWPVLSSTMQLVGAGIKSANKKIGNKSKKKKKGKPKKKGG